MPAQIVHSLDSQSPFTLAIWSITESEDVLHQQWSALASPETMPAIKVSHRRCEWLASRLLLHELNVGPLQFLSNGKPVITKGGVSISHSGKQVAVATYEAAIGIDIQTPTEQLFTIRHKFCSPTEWRWLEQHEEPLRALTMVWSAKEAVFKYWGERVVFAQEMEVMPFQCKDEHLHLRYRGVHGRRDFRLWHTCIDSLEIVVAI
jgi:phosphopantetheinyl transferase